MKETIMLREKPELKFILYGDHFEIIDISEPINEGKYLFNDLVKSELVAKQTDWLVTAISFFTGFGVGGKYKDQAYLKLFFKRKEPLKVWFNTVNYSKIHL